MTETSIKRRMQFTPDLLLRSGGKASEERVDLIPGALVRTVGFGTEVEMVVHDADDWAAFLDRLDILPDVRAALVSYYFPDQP